MQRIKNFKIIIFPAIISAVLILAFLRIGSFPNFVAGFLITPPALSVKALDSLGFNETAKNFAGLIIKFGKFIDRKFASAPHIQESYRVKFIENDQKFERTFETKIYGFFGWELYSFKEIKEIPLFSGPRPPKK